MNLLLVTHPDEGQDRLLPAVMRELRTAHSDCRCRLVHDIQPRVKHRLWTLGRPTAVVSMRPISTWPDRRFAPEWGTRWQQAALDKLQECEQLEKAGLPVPRWVGLSERSQPDLSGFGDFVVVKPAHGSLGALVRVIRRTRTRWRPLEPRLHPLLGRTAVSDALLVQDYIHTGPWPTSYRVGTVFGEPIYATRFVADRSRAPFAERPRDSKAFSGRTIVAGSRGSVVDQEVPADVLALAERAHAAFPTVPLLGTDIVREHDTGKLFVLEVNAAGWTFHLTSPWRDRLLRQYGFDLRTQFGGAAAVARGLASRLRVWAMAREQRDAPPEAVSIRAPVVTRV